MPSAEFAGLDQVVLGTHQLLLSLFALQHFLLEAPVEAFQIAGPLGHPAFEFTAGLGFEGNTFQVMSTALHHQTEQEHHHQQRGATDRDNGTHRAIDQRARARMLTLQPVSAMFTVCVSQAFSLRFSGRGSRVG